MRANGFVVKAMPSREMSAVKRQLGCRNGSLLCHTARIGRYVIEAMFRLPTSSACSPKGGADRTVGPGMPAGLARHGRALPGRPLRGGELRSRRQDGGVRAPLGPGRQCRAPVAAMAGVRVRPSPLAAASEAQVSESCFGVTGDPLMTRHDMCGRHRALAAALVVSALFMGPALAGDETVTGDRGADMAIDLVVVRPLGLAATVVGAVGWVVALPFTCRPGRPVKRRSSSSGGRLNTPSIARSATWSIAAPTATPAAIVEQCAVSPARRRRQADLIDPEMWIPGHFPG